ncbi:hypothetical protein SACE_4944 [Saccharopolyspora erythraea NRRL 2338]|uniref:Uncharacterized protein n=2 Tax=Saccharopolyspora erythraea TaxID=1836 RepID=A4FJI5_SACEN|nr:hypothetical protein SACE_4944 [Saccharopolyspora erythraea NRRL 2338]
MISASSAVWLILVIVAVASARASDSVKMVITGPPSTRADLRRRHPLQGGSASEGERGGRSLQVTEAGMAARTK